MKIQEIRSNQQNKYGEIIEYLKQDNEYWINNDKWDLTEKFFVGKKIYAVRYIDFDKFKNQYIKNEIKYYITYNFKNNLLKNTYIVKLGNTFKHFSVFINKYYKFLETFNSIDKESFSLKFNNYLLINNVMTSQEMKGLPSILDFIKDFYDDREETEKDIWYSKNINGAKIPASGANNGVNNQLNFSTIPIYYRETIKKYFKTIITKKVGIIVVRF
ncbi:phage integrase family protein [Clostridium pasteurianum DSM 525 = ATCC 6013]|uniref:Phage integrase family protein n=1 Tax=Clostridium pasteurianum DSM 525 = ATCC 6013 TaxID=1262449 RepID=A0A0H3J111_CLOPA|nr:phage integrase family protein [Clostridium pasteurianum DSM 525 = ATCC 6013]AJA51032.1 phage integrase family protein [Clostridium pasteurianum DSM 525 = ATCC 6013]